MLRERLADALDIGGDLRIVVAAAELLHQLRMLLGADLLLRRWRQEGSEARFAGGRVGAAAGRAGQDEREREQGGDGANRSKEMCDDSSRGRKPADRSFLAR